MYSISGVPSTAIQLSRDSVSSVVDAIANVAEGISRVMPGRRPIPDVMDDALKSVSRTSGSGTLLVAFFLDAERIER